MYRGRRAPCDADVVARLREAGAIPFGTTTSAEFGCFGPGRARSSVDADRTAGGSGAAAAVASGAVVFACEMRPDGMLSRPASYCGIYGLTVTRGVLSTGGVCSLGTSLEGLGFYEVRRQATRRHGNLSVGQDRQCPIDGRPHGRKDAITGRTLQRVNGQIFRAICHRLAPLGN